MDPKALTAAIAQNVRHRLSESGGLRLVEALCGFRTAEIAEVARNLGVVGLVYPALVLGQAAPGNPAVRELSAQEPLAQEPIAQGPRVREPLVRELRRDWHGLTASSLVMRSIYERVSTSLANAQVRHLPLKGQDLAYRVYQRPEMRPMSDIDVLVPTEQLGAACGALKRDLGAKADDWSLGNTPWQRDYYNRHLYVSIGGKRVLVELHHRMGQLYHDTIDWPGVWTRTEPSGIRAEEFLLCAEDLMLVLCYHLMRSVYARRIHWVLDLEAVAEELRPRWDVVVARATKWRLATGVWCALRMARQILGRAVAPHEIMVALRPAGPRAWYLKQLFVEDSAEIIGRLPNRGVQALGAFPLMDGWSNRLRFGAHYLGLRLVSAYPHSHR